MVQDPKIRGTVRPPIRPDALAATLKVKLEDERHVLDSLVSSLSRGQPLPELWAQLHQAAARDERIPELAFAYERLIRDPKLKFLSSTVQSEILMHAASFLADVFGDLVGATGYLEQVLTLNPTHAEAFTKIESVLALSGNGMKLADVYAAAAVHRPDRDEQLGLLRRAADLADGFSQEHDRAIKIFQSLLRVDPNDQKIRRALEARLRAAGKLRDVARLLEQTLSSSPTPSPQEMVGIRERLVALYAGDLGEPERAMPHLEEILRQDPTHEQARGTVHRLVSHKSLAGRAAGALADAYWRLGTYAESAAMLEISLETLRGQKRADAQKRLGIVKQDKLGDPAGAYTLFEAVVAFDPTDDEVRRRYGELSRKVGKEQDAARLLSRVATGVKEPGLRARLGTEVGEIYLAAKDPKRARIAFASVVEGATGDDPAALSAARALAELHAEANEPRALAQMLELLSRIEPNETARAAAAERLGLVAERELSDKPRAIEAWRKLLGSPGHERALEALERLYGDTESYGELIEVLEKRVDLATNASAARALALRAAELRTGHTKDRARAITAWLDFLGVYGSSREVHAKVIPLLEQEKNWGKLTTILAEDVMLAPDGERVPILLKLAHVRLARLSDAAGAIDAYRQVWAIDPKEPTTKQALEKLLGSPEGRLAAAGLLEPIYRSEGSSGQLLKVLEIRAEAATETATALALYDEAMSIADREQRDPRRALELGGRALRAACEGDLRSIGTRLETLERLSSEAGEDARHATLLSEAIGQRPIDQPELAEVAKRAGEALVSAGDPSGALLMFRRALGFEPSSPELLGRIDGLLAEEGRPEERVVLYRAALAQAESPERRRELYHAIGTIERRDLGNPRAAIVTWRQALAENPSDRVAQVALMDAYEAVNDWPELYDELARALPNAHGDRRLIVLTRMGAVSVKMGDKARALVHYRELLEAGLCNDELLEAVETLADNSFDLATLEEVFEKRVSLAAEPVDTCAWLERLGELQGDRLKKMQNASASFKRAASIAQTVLLDEERARGLYERALSMAPSDVEAAEHLFKSYARAELWNELPRVARALVENASSEGEAVRRLLEFEPQLGRGQGRDTWLSLAEGLFSRGVADRELAFTRAKVLGTDASRQDEAAARFRELLSDAPPGDVVRIVDGFAAFLAKFDATERKDDRRFLWAHKADHAPEAERVPALIAWAHAEEATLSDPKAAVAVYRRVLEIEPERADALEALARLLLSVGDPEGALATLGLLRDSSEGASRRDRCLEMADLLLTLGRPEDALREVTPLIETGPVDAAALAIVYRALEHPQAREQAAALLERAASGAEDDGQKLTILKILLDMPKLETLERARRRWFESLLDLYESQPEVALETALAAVVELPHDEALWGRAEKLARGLDRPDVVATAYRSSLDRAMPSAASGILGKRAVDYQEEWFDDPQAVILLLRRVLDLASDATWARDRLKLAYGSAERWDELFALYDDAVDRAVDEPARAELLSEAAQAAKDFAGDSDRAIGYFERFLVLRPNDNRVRSLLERLYEKQGRIQPLIELLSGTLASLAGEQAQKMRVRIAWLFLRGRRDETAAFKLIEDVLREDPERAEAFTLIEDIVLGTQSDVAAANGSASNGEAADRPTMLSEVDADQPTSSMPPAGSAAAASVSSATSSGPATLTGRNKKKKRSISVRERAASMLKERYRRETRYQELARVLEVELSLAANAKDQARRHQELLSLKTDTLHDDDGAFEHAAALLALEPRISAHRQVLGELAERLSAWERLAEVLVKTAEGSSDAPLVVRLLIEAGEIYRDKVSNDARAIELFASVLALNPKDKELTLSTARELDALLERTSRFEERCAVLEKIAALATEPAARREALTELSRVASDKTHQPDRAIRAWRSYIEEVGTDLEALDGLISILRSSLRWSDLVSALETRAEMAPGEQARQDLVEVACVYGENLHAPDQAVAAWSHVRQRFGPGPETFEPLARLFESMSRWDELAKLVVEETRGIKADPAAPEIGIRLGEMKAKAELCVPRVLDRVLATSVCQELLDAGVASFIPPLASDPSSDAARRWAEATWWALDELVKMALDQREFDLAVRRMLDGSRIVFDVARSRQMQRQAATVASEHLGDAPRAVAVYRDLLAADEEDAVADAAVPELARLLGQLGAFADLADFWEHQASRLAARGLPTSAELWTRAAELSEKRLADIDRAITDYGRSAEAGSQNALRELARLHTQRGDHTRAAVALEGLTYSVSQEHMVADVLALVDAYVGSGDRGRARQRLEKATEIALQPKPLRARLREFYREDDDWTKLADLLRVEAEDADDKPARLELLREAADLHLTKRGEPGAAIPLLEQARKIDPDDQSIGLVLTRALVATSRFEEASAILKAELDRYGNRKPKERALLHFELARVSLKMGERARALAELDLAAKIAPAHPAILSALGKLAAEEGQLDRAQRTFRALLLVLGRPDPDVSLDVGRSEVLFQLAAIARLENDPDRAEELTDSAVHAATENQREAESLERVLRENKSYDLLARLLEARLASTTELDLRAAILCNLVLVYGDHVATDPDTKSRLTALANQVMRELERTSGGGAAGWVALETVYERLGESARQAEILERVGSAMTEGASPAHADALYRLAKLRCQNAATLSDGVALLERAFAMDPRPDQAAQVLVSALEIEPANERYVRLYEKISRAAGKTTARTDSLVRLVRLGVATPDEQRDAVGLVLEASNGELAESMLTRILEGADLEPSQSVWAKTLLAELCLKSGDLARATDLAEQVAPEAPLQEGRTLLLDIAKVAMGPLQDLGGAARIYAALRKQTPADRDIWWPLLEIYRKLDATEALIALIAETLPLIESPAERSRLRLEQATALLLDPATQEKAAGLLREVLEDDPTQVDAAMLLSGILERGGRSDELVALIEHQLDAAKDRADIPSIVSLAMRLGTLLEERNRTPEALDVYRAALDWDPKSKTPLYALVRLSESHGDPFEIAEALEKLIAVETGESAEAIAMRLFALRSEQGDVDAAERALEAGMRAHPTSTQLSELLIARYQTRGAYDELAVLLKQAFSRAPDNLSLLGALLDAYRRTGAIDAAFEVVSVALERAPDNADLYLERARLSESRGMTADALSDFEKAFAVGGAPHMQDYVQALKREASRVEPPGDRPIKLKLSEVLCTGGFSDAGRTYLIELLKRDAKDRVALEALADLEYREQRWDAASSIYRRLLPLEEGEALVEAALRLADACERASRLPDARGGLERALEASPSNAAVRARLCDLYDKTGADGPLAQLVLADASKESDVSGRFALLIRAATLLLGQEGNPSQAIQVLEEARTLRPEDDDGILLLGRAYVTEGRSAEALALFQATVQQRKAKRSKQLSAMHREISRIHLQDGDLSAALEALTKAFDMDLHNGEIALELGLLAKDLDEEELAARAFRSVTFMKASGGVAGDGATPAAKGLSYFFLGQMARKSGDVRKARLLAQKAVIEDPNLEQARTLLEELKSA